MNVCEYYKEIYHIKNENFIYYIILEIGRILNNLFVKILYWTNYVTYCELFLNCTTIQIILNNIFCVL